MTDKQRLFCIIYSRCLNATKAYQKAYHCTYETAMVNGPRLLGNARVKEQINKLNAIEFNKEFIRKSVLQKYIDIAFADITEYIKFGQRDEPVIDKDGNPALDENGFIKTESYSYVELGESSQVDGTLINEIAQGKGGIKIKLADKMKALDVLNRYSNLLSDEEKVKLELENKKLANRKLSAELNKINGTDDTNVEDDGFIEALNGRAAEVWNNE
ncbi:terminase small subunit [Clostridium neonatale]|uniref:terminase small subunit n=1 Tax=Clostridium neonatale TaxID=137838 RepID=UPI00397ABA5D